MCEYCNKLNKSLGNAVDYMVAKGLIKLNKVTRDTKGNIFINGSLVATYEGIIQ